MTPTAPKTTVPPATDDDNHDVANKMRKRFIAQLEKLPNEWQRWIVEDLNRKFPAKEAGQ